MRLVPIYGLAAALMLCACLGRVLPVQALWVLLAIAALLLFWRAMRLFSLLFVFCAFMLYRQTPPDIPQEVCHFAATVTDFAQAVPPRAQRVAVKVEHSADCPSLQGAPLSLFDYDKRDLPLASRWQMRAKVRVDGEVFATLQDAQALPDSRHPVLRLRAALDTRIRAHFADDTARWFQALLIGNRSALQEWDRRLLRQTGTSHLLAISGLHVALVALMAYWLGKTLWSLSHRVALALAPRDAGLVFMLVLALAYVLLSGAQAPAVRAWVMLAGVSLHWFTPRVQSGLQGLALAACVSLILDPKMLFAIGAWLSYLATFVVLLAWQRYRNLPALWQWPLLQGWITLALLPLTWAWFGGVSVVGFFANLLVIPWLGVLLLLGFLACAQSVFIAPAQFVLDHYLATLRFFADLPAAYQEFFWQPSTFSAAIAFALVASVLARRKRFALALLPLLLIAVIWQIWPTVALYQSPNGNAALLHGREMSVVINPGYRYRERDDARRYLLPELRRRGRAPAFVVITEDKKRAHSALKTLLDHYPHTPVYSLVPLKDFPFAVEVCVSPPLSADCTLTLDGYHISAAGIQKLDD